MTLESSVRLFLCMSLADITPSLTLDPGGVLTLFSFENDFRYTAKQATKTSSLSNSLQQLGAFIACFAIWPVTHKLGRRWAIVICSFIFCEMNPVSMSSMSDCANLPITVGIGAMIQTINTHSRAAFYVARVIAGLGLGGSSVIVPMFSSEMTPKQIRGQIGSFYQLFYTFGTYPVPLT